MRLTLLGATGPLGDCVARQAVARGHRVRAVVRDPARLKVPVQDVVTGGATDPACLAGAVAGADAVVSALGPGTTWKARRTSTVMTDSTRAILPAMDESGVGRFVGISALGVGPTWRDLPFVLRPMYRLLLRQPMRDKEGMERLLEASHTEWTLVYPPILTTGPATGYVAGERLPFRGAAQVSREDVASLMLDCVEGKVRGRRLEVASQAGTGS